MIRFDNSGTSSSDSKVYTISRQTSSGADYDSGTGSSTGSQSYSDVVLYPFWYDERSTLLPFEFNPEPIIFYISVLSYKDYPDYLSGRFFVAHHLKFKSRPFIKKQICRKQFKQLKTFKNLRFK